MPVLHNLMHANHYMNQKILTHLKQENPTKMVGDGGGDLSVVRDFKPKMYETNKYRRNRVYGDCLQFFISYG